MPSVRGQRSQGEQLAGVIAYVFALLGGAVILAAVLHLVATFWRPPLITVGMVSAICATLPGTIEAWHDRHAALVPKRWARVGHTVFSAIFGGAQGLGFVTPVASGFWVLVAWALAADRLGDAVAPFAVFAGMRALPMLLVLATSREPGRMPKFEAVQTVARLVPPVERSVLAITVLVLLLNI